MDEQIKNLLEGNFDYGNGSLDFSCTKLELSLLKGETLEGSFKVYGPKGKLTRGTVFTSEPRMHCIHEEFVGEEEEIAYVFDSTGLEEGDVIKGEFYFLSNQGEYYLPFVVSVSYQSMDSSLGVIRNLFHFTNLAKTNWEESRKLFYSEQFLRVFNGSDRQYSELYKGLSVYKGNEQNMEEFLLAINKKQKTEYLIDTPQIKIEEPQSDGEYSFLITRNGWGYTGLDLESQSGLLVPEKSHLSDDDFLGNNCRVHFKLREDKLHRGNNFDILQIKTPYDTLKVSVSISVGAPIARGSTRRTKKQLTVQLMEYYQAFRLKKISASTWLKETQKLVEQLIALDEKSVSSRLFQAQLLISQERFNEAQWILDHAVQMLPENMDEEPVLWAYQLYLTSLSSREELYTNEVAFQVEELYKRHGDWRIAWLLLYLSEEYNRSGSKKWMFLEEQFRRGCVSPMLYIEALLLIHMNPTLLMKLGSFEVQILYYAARMEVLTQDMIEQLWCLVPREREFSQILFRVLVAAYKKKPNKETLAAICSLLMKGGKTEHKYFIWYERAVEEGLRLTRLYDYYMLALNTEKHDPIHKMVLMYFSYHSDLDYERNACLYADVHKRREEFPELYLTYLPQIEQFVEDQIRKTHMNPNLALLYKAYFKEQMVNEQTAYAMASLLFMHRICVEDERFLRVIVCQPHRKEEAVYALTEGKAIVPLYTTDAVILFEDGNRQRFTGSGKYTMEKLMLPGKMLKMILGHAYDAVGLNLYLSEGGRDGLVVTQENEMRVRALVFSMQVENSYRRDLSVALVKYYFETDRIEELDDFLNGLKAEHFTSTQRNELLGYMVQRGMYDKAFTWLQEFGTYGLDAKMIVRLLGERIARYGMEENPVLTEMGIYAFRHGKYNEQILQYLVQFYHGLTRELRDLWKAAQGFSVDTYSLCEKMILQMLFTGSFVGEKMEIFKSYVKGGARYQVEEAFLSQCAYDYFVCDRVMDVYVFEEMLKVLARKEQLHFVCTLAVVKYYAEHTEQMKEEEKELLADHVKELLRRQIHLPFLKKYAGFVPEVAILSDKTLIEYHATPGTKAMIHYVLEKTEDDPGEYRTEEMAEAFGGICFKEFQLFFGESIQYYITEETEDNSQLTESDAIQKSDIEKGIADCRYDLVNDIVIAQTLQDYDTVDVLLEEYERNVCLTEKLFELK